MKKIFIIAAIFTFVVTAPSYASVLWYNGDFSDSGLSNEINTAVSHSQVFDDFIVPSGGWTINTLWGNNQINFTGITSAYWEIRSGVSSGDGGTIVSSGTNSATQSYLGTGIHYKVEVAGLNIFIPQGTYWLSVAPIGSGGGQSWLDNTIGVNAVGTPAGNNDNAFWYSSYWAKNFEPAQSDWDFSMGVGGTLGGGVVPEPATMALLGMGLIGLAGLRRKE